MDENKCLFTICKTYATAAYACLMLEQDEESSMYLNGIYDALSGSFNDSLYSTASTITLLNIYDNGRTVDEAATEGLEGCEVKESFVECMTMTDKYVIYTWALDTFMTYMKRVVHWLDANPEADAWQLNDLVNTVFYDAELNDDEITFVAFEENINKVAELLNKSC